MTRLPLFALTWSSDCRGESSPDPVQSALVERTDVGDRQLDAVLERLDRLCGELHTLNRRVDSAEALTHIAHELRSLNDSLQALAYAALGHQGPQVRRRRAS